VTMEVVDRDPPGKGRTAHEKSQLY
jgi:hypothetical protein